MRIQQYRLQVYIPSFSDMYIVLMCYNVYRILDTMNVPYETVDVLADPEIRAGIKIFSSWPTIPQLYINGEFIGGSDIMLEMYQSGELAEMCEIANAN